MALIVKDFRPYTREEQAYWRGDGTKPKRANREKQTNDKAPTGFVAVFFVVIILLGAWAFWPHGASGPSPNEIAANCRAQATHAFPEGPVNPDWGLTVDLCVEGASAP